ncbi:MAG: T9SS type A sorting domain-containing protein, partial [Bacteroidota bacterium]|nr:T9SS type A sorting domain-containing protein [Bacteroidota bacterium]
IRVVEYPLPVPQVVRNGDTLATGPYAAYQWRLNGADIPGETARTMIPRESGRYSVQVVDRNGCVGVSPEIEFAREAGTAGVALLCAESAVYPVGTVVRLPLRLERLRVSSPSAAGRYTAAVSTNPAVAFPLFGTEASAGSDRRVYRVGGTRDASLQAGVLMELRFEVLWGDTACTRVRLESVEWDDGTVTEILASECDICAELCYEGGARLFLRDGRLSLTAHPNPFNASTVIEFEVIEEGTTDLSVYDLMGRRVANLLHGEVKPGRYLRRFDSSPLASGMYVCVLLTPSGPRTVLLEIVQ